jgi:hypothetical protein
MRLDMKALLQSRGNARFAEAGFARNQDNLAVPRLGAFPAAHQTADFLVPAN